MGYLEKLSKKKSLVSILEAIVFGILGGILIWQPDGTLKVVAYILGAIFIIAGIYKIINYVASQGKYDALNYDMAYGFTAIMLGICIMLFSSTINSIFRIIIGLWIVYTSIIEVNASFKLKSLNLPIWIYSLILSIAMFCCGLYVTLNSGAIIVTIGVFMIIYAVIDIIENIIFMKNIKEFFYN